MECTQAGLDRDELFFFATALGTAGIEEEPSAWLVTLSSVFTCGFHAAGALVLESRVEMLVWDPGDLL
jgi:hypothetical protein